MHICFALLLKHNAKIPKPIQVCWQKSGITGLHPGVNNEIIKSISRLKSLRETGEYSILPSITEDDLEPVETIFGRLRTLYD